MPRVPVDAFAAKVMAAREERRLSRPALAKLAGVHPNLLERLESANPPTPKRPTVIDLSWALGLDVDAELKAFGYKPLTAVERANLPSSDDDSWSELERLWDRLTPQQRHAVVDLVRAFVEGRRKPREREPLTVVQLGKLADVPEPEGS